MQPPNRRRVVWALVASTLVHLLLLAVYVRMADWYRREELRPTRYLPDLLILVPELLRQQRVTRLPERLLERQEAPPADTDAPALPAVEIPRQAPVATDSAAAPEALRDDLTEPAQRPLVFLADTEDLDLNERQIEAVRQLRDTYDTYARFWVPLADSASEAGRSRTRAEAIVARAFEAMGGLDRLLKITEIRRIVWVIASETLIPGAGLVGVSPYPYPIAYWRGYGLDRFEEDVFRVEVDLSGDRPAPAYLTKNPASTRQAYYLLFGARWLTSAPATTRQLRIQGDHARWHFVDRFLGEGIALRYEGAGRMEVDRQMQPVHEVFVDDRKYGRQKTAYFHQKTGLLVATRERLAEAEAVWYRERRQGRGGRPPTWSTTFGDYRDVDGVRLPHRWVRTVSPAPPPMPHRVDVRFNIAVNGAQPDTLAPAP